MIYDTIDWFEFELLAKMYPGTGLIVYSGIKHLFVVNGGDRQMVLVGIDDDMACKLIYSLLKMIDDSYNGAIELDLVS